MDSARHVIQRISNPRFPSQNISYEMASTLHQFMTSRDVASTIHDESLAPGRVHRHFLTRERLR